MADNISSIKKLNNLKFEAEAFTQELGTVILNTSITNPRLRTRLDEITSRLEFIVEHVEEMVSVENQNISNDLNISLLLITHFGITCIDSLRYLYRLDTKMDEFNQKSSLDNMGSRLHAFNDILSKK